MAANEKRAAHLAELDGELIRLILALGDPSELLVEE